MQYSNAYTAVHIVNLEKIERDNDVAVLLVEELEFIVRRCRCLLWVVAVVVGVTMKTHFWGWSLSIDETIFFYIYIFAALDSSITHKSTRPAVYWRGRSARAVLLVVRDASCSQVECSVLWLCIMQFCAKEEWWRKWFLYYSDVENLDLSAFRVRS